MTSFHAEIEAALRAYLEANLAGVNADWTGARVLWPNVDAKRSGGAASYVQVEIDFDGQAQANLGALVRIDGTLTLTGVVRRTAGQNELMAWRDALRDLFAMGTKITFGGGSDRVLFKEPQPQGVQYTDDGFAGLPLVCRFYTHVSG